jgi:hypothetical protein
MIPESPVEKDLKNSPSQEKEELKELMKLQEREFYQQQREATTDRTREIAFVNKITPFKYEIQQNEKGEIISQSLVEGEAPMEKIVEYYSLNSPYVSLTNIQSKEDEIILDSMVNIIQMDNRQQHTRKWFNVNQNTDDDQVALLFLLRLMMSRQNQERQNTISAKNITSSGYQLIKSKAGTLMNKVGVGER